MSDSPPGQPRYPWSAEYPTDEPDDQINPHRMPPAPPQWPDQPAYPGWRGQPDHGDPGGYGGHADPYSGSGSQAPPPGYGWNAVAPPDQSPG